MDAKIPKKLLYRIYCILQGLETTYTIEKPIDEQEGFDDWETSMRRYMHHIKEIQEELIPLLDENNLPSSFLLKDKKMIPLDSKGNIVKNPSDYE